MHDLIYAFVPAEVDEILLAEIAWDFAAEVSVNWLPKFW
jgi:hypothetical protein